VSGQGTVTDNDGGTWNYTYNGTVTSSTTTTSYVNLPFTDTATSIYAYSYDQAGHLVSERRRTITTRQGGDGANTLGYNLGAALVRIHFRERLLKDAVNDLTR
jgi:YD repeat-containing protein